MEGNWKPFLWLIILALYIAKTYYERRRKAQEKSADNNKTERKITVVNTRKEADKNIIEDPYDFRSESEQMIEKGSVEYVYERPVTGSETRSVDLQDDSDNDYQYSVFQSRTVQPKTSFTTRGGTANLSELQTKINSYTSSQNRPNTENQTHDPNAGEHSQELNIGEIDWRKALIYSEILKPKF